jgi:hypothetical protein
MEARIAEVHVAGAVDAFPGLHHPRLQRGERHDHLEGGARRVEPVRRLVDQRRRAVRRPFAPLLAETPELKTFGSKEGWLAMASTSPFAASMRTTEVPSSILPRIASAARHPR